MQTPAEKHLVRELIKVQNRDLNSCEPLCVLNIGAGQSLSIENQLTEAGCNYIYHRVDKDDCTVAHQFVEKCWTCSVESMSPVDSDRYHAAFANYVLEHIPDLNKAAREIYRVLKPAGIFIASIPNPISPEIALAKRTPLWFHKKIRSGETWETFYAYKNIRELTEIFESNGFRTIEIVYYAFVQCYLGRLFLLGMVARFYDKVISALKIKRMMGNVCIVFEKNS